MNKVLILTDFSAASTHAIHYAQTFFGDVPTQFCLLNAYPIELEAANGAIYAMETLRQAAADELTQLKESLEASSITPTHTYETRTLAGGPVGALEAILANESFDWVVLGATGAGRSEWLGSVSTGVIRAATAHVLVVPATAPIRPLSHVVLATDANFVRSTECLEPVKVMLEAKNADLTVLTIENPDRKETKMAPETLDQVQLYFDPVKPLVYYIHDNEVVRGIDAYLETHPVDLLVTVPHRKSLVDALFGRSVTRSLAYHPRVPLLALYDAAPVSPANTDPTEVPFATYL
jgi:nucleotide-binding universal stress UspA family protein